MNIRDIKYFVEVVEHKNFTKAADSLYISQPALSKAIKHLEKDISIELIKRNTKTFTLTSEGQRFYEKAKKSLQIIDLELESLNNMFENKKEILKLGLPPVIGTVMFAPIIIKFSQEYPNIEVQIIEKGSNEIKEEITNGKIDLGVIVLSNEEDFNITQILCDEVVVAINNKHDLASKDKVDLIELKNERFISFDENFKMYNKTINACRTCGFSPNIVMKSSQWDFMLSMISHNLGVSIMPKPIVDKFKNKDIKTIEIGNPKITWDVGFINGEKTNNFYPMQTFIEYTINYINEEILRNK